MALELVVSESVQRLIQEQTLQLGFRDISQYLHYLALQEQLIQDLDIDRSIISDQIRDVFRALVQADQPSLADRYLGETILGIEQSSNPDHHRIATWIRGLYPSIVDHSIAEFSEQQPEQTVALLGDLLSLAGSWDGDDLRECLMLARENRAPLKI
jgi:hypothetical protein